MDSKTCFLNELRPGHQAEIISFTDYELSLKLLEMGCIPGETILVSRIAPLGDPMAIIVSGYQLSLRKDEAATIRVKLIN